MALRWWLCAGAGVKGVPQQRHLAAADHGNFRIRLGSKVALTAVLIVALALLLLFSVAIPVKPVELGELAVVTMAQDGLWGVCTAGSHGPAIAAPIYDCRAMLGGSSDCGAHFTSRGGWVIAGLCGNQKIFVTAATLEDAERAVMERERKLSVNGVLAASVNTRSSAGPEPDPLSVVRALMEAERAANLDAALALFAADAFILNVTGWKTADREELKWFINTEIWFREDFALNHHRVAGNRVTWDEAATESFYQGIGVAPVQFVFEATIKSGKIKSIIAHLPAGQIARISKACGAQAMEPLIHGRPCSEFVQLVEAHTKRHSSAARAQ
jgi:hypothetical protein